MISLIITLAVVGVILWLINAYLPCEPWVKKLFNIVALVCVVFFVLRAFGVLGHGDVPVPQLR